MKQRKNNRYLWYVPFVLLFIFFIGRSLYVQYYRNNILTLDKPEEYRHEVSVKGVVIRDEYVYVDHGDLVDYPVGRIPFGTELTLSSAVEDGMPLFDPPKKEHTTYARIHDYDQDRGHEENIDLDIVDTYEPVEEIDEEGPTKDLNEVRQEMIQSIQNKDYRLADKDIVYYQTKSRQNGEALLRSRSIERIQEQVKSGKTTLKVLTPGMLSDDIDHFEDILYFQMLDTLSVGDYNDKLESVQKEDRSKGVKIVNNLEWYLWVEANVDDFKYDFSPGDSIRIKINDVEVVGRVSRMEKQDQRVMLILHFDTNFEDIENDRFLTLDIVDFRTSAFKIPKRALIEKEGVQGIKIVNSVGIVSFIPVEVLDEKDGDVYIQSGNDRTIAVDGEEMRTAKSFDRVILNPTAVEEGTLIE